MLALLIHNFDMTLARSDTGWFQMQQAYLVWDSPPLNSHLRPITTLS